MQTYTRMYVHIYEYLYVCTYMLRTSPHTLLQICLISFCVSLERIKCIMSCCSCPIVWLSLGTPINGQKCLNDFMSTGEFYLRTLEILIQFKTLISMKCHPPCTLVYCKWGIVKNYCSLIVVQYIM